MQAKSLPGKQYLPKGHKIYKGFVKSIDYSPHLGYSFWIGSMLSDAKQYIVYHDGISRLNELGKNEYVEVVTTDHRTLKPNFSIDRVSDAYPSHAVKLVSIRVGFEYFYNMWHILFLDANW